MPEASNEMPTGDNQARAKRLFRFGIVVSVLYAGGLIAYAWFVHGAMLAMTPDKFATFLSGVFAPLAFLWLVLGFRQQGDELQNSARALWLQGEELRNSVEQQRALVEVSREQLAAEYSQRVRDEEDADRAAQPQLIMPEFGGSYSGPERTLRLEVKNTGPACAEAELWIDDHRWSRATYLPEGGSIIVERRYGGPEEVEPFEAVVKYTDSRGNRRSQSFFVPTDEQGGPNGDRTLGAPVKVSGYETV